MESDKEFIARLWNSRWTKWLMIFGLAWQIGSGWLDPILIFFDKFLQPVAIKVSGVSPNSDDVSEDRHSFLAGYYSYELFNSMKNSHYVDWPNAFNDNRYRLESSLIALNVPNASLANKIDPSKIANAMETYQRLRIHTEAFLDGKSKKGLSTFHLGFNLALLISESGNVNPSHETIHFYLAETKSNLMYVRENSLNKIPKLELEQLNDCCKGYLSGLVSSFLELKKFYEGK